MRMRTRMRMRMRTRMRRRRRRRRRVGSQDHDEDGGAFGSGVGERDEGLGRGQGGGGGGEYGKRWRRRNFEEEEEEEEKEEGQVGGRESLKKQGCHGYRVGGEGCRVRLIPTHSAVNCVSDRIDTRSHVIPSTMLQHLPSLTSVQTWKTLQASMINPFRL
eukprot:1844890-Rhodomonas_salina.4